MEKTITFDEAIEILEITDISKVTVDTLPKVIRKAKKRWHPDKVSHQKDQSIVDEYTTKFQQIEIASEMVASYLVGTYKAGEAFEPSSENYNTEEPEEVIRKNAPDIQSSIKSVWDLIKEKKYKWTLKDVVLSDGFVLKDLLTEDFKEDISSLSIISLVYGTLGLGVLMMIGGMISPIIASIIGIVWFVHMLSCVISFLPLSRFWLPEKVVDFVLKFVNYGLKIYTSIFRMTENGNVFLHLLVVLPELFAKAVKYVILFPLYEIAKLFVKDKVVGVVKDKVNYYAEAAEWYVDELINKNPNEMTTEELYHLSYMYGELMDVKSEM
jgi:hypothetical protein